MEGFLIGLKLIIHGSQKQWKTALDAATQGISICRAALDCGVPKSTLGVIGPAIELYQEELVALIGF